LAEEGCKLVHGGKAEAGFSMLQKAFDEDPHDTKVLLCMAEAHMKLDRMPSARAMVERVVRKNGKNKKALQLAAKIEDELGNERSAADYYRKLLELDPDNATAKAYVEKHGG
jgi:Tfp pilus assembly protein PilF